METTRKNILLRTLSRLSISSTSTTISRISFESHFEIVSTSSLIDVELFPRTSTPWGSQESVLAQVWSFDSTMYSMFCEGLSQPAIKRKLRGLPQESSLSDFIAGNLVEAEEIPIERKKKWFQNRMQMWRKAMRTFFRKYFRVQIFQNEAPCDCDACKNQWKAESLLNKTIRPKKYD